MIFLLFLCIEVDLDRIGVYDPQDIQLFQFGDGFLICEYREAGLIILNAAGAKIGEYRQRGQGPRELHHPVAMGFEDGNVLILSNRKNNIAFNASLQPASGRYPPLPPAVSQNVFIFGGSLGGNGFYVVRSGMSVASHLLVRIVLDDDAWRIVEEAAPQPSFKQAQNPTGMPQAKFFSMRDSPAGFFIFRHNLFVHEDDYEVRLYEKRPAGLMGDLVQVLSADITELEAINRYSKAYFTLACATPAGFAVEFRSGKDETYYHDRFKPDGSYVARDRGDYILVPSHNSSHVFRHDLGSDTMRLIE